MGATKDQWLHTCSMKRRLKQAIDPNTRLPTWTSIDVLTDEPCDLSVIQNRVSVRGPNGTVYQTVMTPTLRIHPDDPELVPDNNDEITVSGPNVPTRRYRVVNQNLDYDAGDLRFMGAVCQLETMVPDPDNPTDDPPGL